ncbi:MAG: hypothetical protein GF317_08500 [Candidatus Lokiarchaeota archaeon]|nr:hypothetical protein [Candidatus Lokiarchaeota archaeon]MBD3199754.1 hypothetical protein [Candidatus Lokiarchaeota archaeon]
MPESSVILNDINKVFVPCRTVIEMEALTSLFLEYKNYESIKELPKTQPTSKQLIEIFKVVDIEPLERIIEYFIDVVVNRLKPIVMYAREHHARFRMGNIVAYTKTRVCLYFALHRLKLKFLIVKHFLDQFKENPSDFVKTHQNSPESLLSELYDYYSEKNLMNLKLILSKRRISERVAKLLESKNSITNEDIINALTFKHEMDEKDKIRFIMREIKASLFVCKIMFAKIDVPNPFIVPKETEIKIEDIMVDQDFLPGLINAMSKCIKDYKLDQLKNCFKAYEFMMNLVLNGINYAIELASGGQIELEIDDMIYHTGNIFIE